MTDNVNHPQHYEKHAVRLEPIDIIGGMPFVVGNVFKYIIRSKDKGNELEDLRKARFYIDRAIRMWDTIDTDAVTGKAWVLSRLDIPCLSRFASAVLLAKTRKTRENAWLLLDGELAKRIKEISNDVSV